MVNVFTAERLAAESQKELCFHDPAYLSKINATIQLLPQAKIAVTINLLINGMNNVIWIGEGGKKKRDSGK